MQELEQKIEEIQTKYELLKSSSFEAIFFSENGICTGQNESAQKMFGYSDEEAIGRPALDWIHPDDHPLVKQKLSIPSATPYEVKAIKKDKTIFLAEVQAKSVELHGRRVRVTALRDITEKKEAQKKRMISDARYRALIEHSLSGIFYIDTEGNILEANQRIADMMGSPSVEATKSINVLTFQPLIDMGYAESMKKCIETGEVVFGQNKYQSKWGKTLYVYYYFSPIKEDGKTIGLLANVDDITEKRSYEKKLEKSIREKETLIRELFHRTKNNMQVIASIIGLQSLRSKNQEVRDILFDTDVRIQAMSVAHEKLYKSKNLSEIPMDDYIQDVARFILNAYQKGKNEISLNIKINSEIMCIIDLALPIGLIISELISNSVRHAFKQYNDPMITIEINQTENQNEFIYHDNGIGLPEDFDYTKSESLGLATVFNIAENQLLGRYEINSKNGFYFKLTFANNIYWQRV